MGKLIIERGDSLEIENLDHPLPMRFKYKDEVWEIRSEFLYCYTERPKEETVWGLIRRWLGGKGKEHQQGKYKDRQSCL